MCVCVNVDTDVAKLDSVDSDGTDCEVVNVDTRYNVQYRVDVGNEAD